MKWYAIRRFSCPRCGQKLAVHGAQVEGGEQVTCQDCNLDMLLAPKGRTEHARARLREDWQLIEL